MTLSPVLAMRATVAVVMVALVVIVVIAGTLAAAQVFAIPAHEVISRSSSTAITPDDRDAALQYLQRSQKLEPANGRFSEMAGQILLLAGEPGSAGAVAAFRDAVRSEPAKAYAWVMLSAAKAAQGTFDEEFSQAYRNAAAYGPWDYKTNWLLVEIGLHALGSLTDADRVILQEAIRKLYHKEPGRTIQRARALGQFEMACLWVVDLPQKDGFCARLLRYNQ